MKTIHIETDVQQFQHDGQTIYSAWVYVKIDGRTIKARHAGHEMHPVVARLNAEQEARGIGELLEAVTGIEPTHGEAVQ